MTPGHPTDQPLRREGASALVSLDNICLEIGGKIILDSVDLSVGRGEIVTLVGPNGSGKTTLVRVLLGLTVPSSGRVAVQAGTRIGYVPQHFSVDRALPLTVERFLRLAVKAGGRSAAPSIRQVLDEVGVGYAAGVSMHGLSGGEVRRVVLARALLRQPDLLVLDEPMAGVDVTGQAELYQLIDRIRRHHDCGVLVVSHDLHLVMATTDRVFCLNRHICCSGAPEQVSRDPEFLAMFGPGLGRALAPYSHHHAHHHDLAGGEVGAEAGAGAKDGGLADG